MSATLIELLNPTTATALAEAIASRRLAPPFSLAALGRYVAPDQAGAIAVELEHLVALGLTSPQLAYVLHLAAAAHQEL